MVTPGCRLAGRLEPDNLGSYHISIYDDQNKLINTITIYNL
jgi:hypothetical protein